MLLQAPDPKYPDRFGISAELTTLFENMVDPPCCVRDKPTDANHWLIGCGWPMVKVRFRVTV